VSILKRRHFQLYIRRIAKKNKLNCHFILIYNFNKIKPISILSLIRKKLVSELVEVKTKRRQTTKGTSFYSGIFRSSAWLCFNMRVELIFDYF
jgi:hypothetical protein